MKTYFEVERTLPVIDEIDVLVAGGGPAGVGAAIAAARNGAKTMLLEHFGCLGGIATSGLMSHWTGASEGPIYEEILNRCQAQPWPGENADSHLWQHINHEKLKLVLFDMLEEAGVTMQLHTDAVDVIMDGNRIIGVITQSKSGREAIMAKVVIDCTGDGDLAARAGAEYAKGREEDGLMQPVTLMFKIDGVDYERAIFPGSFETKVEVPEGEIQALGHCILPAPAGHVLLYQTPIAGQVMVNMTNLTGIDGTSARDLTRAEIECHRQVPKIIAFLRQYAPGYENCRLLETAAVVGVRETRHFKGLYTLTAEDIVEARVFPDWIATRNSFNFDIHNVKGSGLDPDGAQAHFRSRGKYTIPYSCCVPEKVDGLLLAGRNISGTHKAHSSFRVMPICVNIGQGAGTAAAVAVRESVIPRKVDLVKVQELLLRHGVNL
ncbi:MAG: FAD-dependent oxidoreductase [Victivallaceae bacterium]|jgi:glycine/D-amino acid oxidase-like deaminating enzyme